MGRIVGWMATLSIGGPVDAILSTATFHWVPDHDALFRNLSPFRFDEPFFYGLFRKHIFIVMFDRTEGIRLTHSPSGGGVNSDAATTNPAWDFQYLLPKYEVKREYGFRARVVYRERCGRDEVLREYETWRKGK